MKNSMSKDEWFNVLSALFDMHVGHDNVDEDGWIEDYNKGKSPHDAFYDEFPEYEGMED
jgi:putative heme degradation protein